jgi:hypothetical protein
LQQAAQFLERNYTTTGCYNYSGACSGTGLITAPTPANAPIDGGRYTYALTVTFPTGQTFLLAAAPCGTSATACTSGDTSFTDPFCGALTLDNTGLQGIDLTGTGTQTPSTTGQAVSKCWQQ